MIWKVVRSPLLSVRSSSFLCSLATGLFMGRPQNRMDGFEGKRIPVIPAWPIAPSSAGLEPPIGWPRFDLDTCSPSRVRQAPPNRLQVRAQSLISLFLSSYEEYFKLQNNFGESVDGYVTQMFAREYVWDRSLMDACFLLIRLASSYVY